MNEEVQDLLSTKHIEWWYKKMRFTNIAPSQPAQLVHGISREKEDEVCERDPKEAGEQTRVMF
ncbi:hypothetical protein GBA52_015805 [Prunus armeniaca]|nr:hypothetical protein GBA52_015805 [Prunus armeniaca]